MKFLIDSTITRESVDNFLNQLKDCVEVKPRFGKCQIEVKAKSITKNDDGIIIEFASKEDSNLFWCSDTPVKIVLV